MHPEDAVHMNAEGIRLFAEAVVERIRKLGWVDRTYGVKTPFTRDKS
jgi:lysophospholipase L1-like esterase